MKKKRKHSLVMLGKEVYLLLWHLFQKKQCCEELHQTRLHPKLLSIPTTFVHLFVHSFLLFVTPILLSKKTQVVKYFELVDIQWVLMRCFHRAQTSSALFGHSRACWVQPTKREYLACCAPCFPHQENDTSEKRRLLFISRLSRTLLFQRSCSPGHPLHEWESSDASLPTRRKQWETGVGLGAPFVLTPATHVMPE